MPTSEYLKSKVISILGGVVRDLTPDLSVDIENAGTYYSDSIDYWDYQKDIFERAFHRSMFDNIEKQSIRGVL